MTLWTPVWRVKINGVAYTSISLSNLTISSGRTNIYEQANPSYCNLQLINTDKSNVLFSINDGVTVEVQDSSSAYVPIFGGNISDIQVEVSQSGTVDYVQTISITAIGALARLNKALTEGVLTKDFDGDQIYALLSDFLLNNWSEVPSAVTWASYDPTTTWANAENSGLGEIDQPGDYELTSRSANTIDLYSICSDIASSALGYLYEDAQGRICYADSTHRSEYLANNGYTEINGGNALANGIRTLTRVGDVRNAVTITYKNNASVSASDSASILEFGKLEEQFNTTLENGYDATDQADFYLALRAYPRAYFDALSYQLVNDQMTNLERDSLLNIFMGMPIRIQNLPNNMGAQFEGYVEGWTWSTSYNALALTIITTPVDFSTVSQKWQSVSVGESWNTVSNTLEWQNAFVVA